MNPFSLISISKVKNIRRQEIKDHDNQLRQKLDQMLENQLFDNSSDDYDFNESLSSFQSEKKSSENLFDEIFDGQIKQDEKSSENDQSISSIKQTEKNNRFKKSSSLQFDKIQGSLNQKKSFQKYNSTILQDKDSENSDILVSQKQQQKIVNTSFRQTLVKLAPVKFVLDNNFIKQKIKRYINQLIQSLTDIVKAFFKSKNQGKNLDQSQNLKIKMFCLYLQSSLKMINQTTKFILIKNKNFFLKLYKKIILINLNKCNQNFQDIIFAFQQPRIYLILCYLIQRRDSNQIDQRTSVLNGYTRQLDIISAIISSALFIFTLIQNEEFIKEIMDENNNIIKPKYQNTDLSITFQYIQMQCSLGLVLFAYLRYEVTLMTQKVMLVISKKDTLYSSGLLKPMLLEMFFCAIFCPPAYNKTFKGRQLNGSYEYSYNEIINVIHYFKSYNFLRLYQHYTIFNKRSSKRIAKQNKTDCNLSFNLKSTLENSPFMMIGIAFFSSVVFQSLAIRTFELTYIPNQGSLMDFQEISNAFWVTIITMTTVRLITDESYQYISTRLILFIIIKINQKFIVGFGDGYPSTHLGRLIGVIGSLLGMSFTSIMVVSMRRFVQFTTAEKKAFKIIEKLQLNDGAKKHGALCIIAFIRFRMLLKYDQFNRNDQELQLKVLKSRQFNYNQNYKIASATQLPLEEILSNLNIQLMKASSNMIQDFQLTSQSSQIIQKIREQQKKQFQEFQGILNFQQQILKIIQDQKKSTPKVKEAVQKFQQFSQGHNRIANFTPQKNQKISKLSQVAQANQSYAVNEILDEQSSAESSDKDD